MKGSEEVSRLRIRILQEVEATNWTAFRSEVSVLVEQAGARIILRLMGERTGGQNLCIGPRLEPIIR